jgi:hypothetical protein
VYSVPPDETMLLEPPTPPHQTDQLAVTAVSHSSPPLSMHMSSSSPLATASNKRNASELIFSSYSAGQLSANGKTVKFDKSDEISGGGGGVMRYRNLSHSTSQFNFSTGMAESTICYARQYTGYYHYLTETFPW